MLHFIRSNEDLLDTGSFEKPYYTLREENAHVLDYQIFEMFESVRKTGGMNPYPKPVYREGEKPRASLTDTEAYLNERVPVTEVQLFNPGLPITHPGDFELCVRKSIIDHPESGYGVFVDRGYILPGTVVAFYPGTVHFHENLTKQVTDHNEYMISRYDDAVVDGRSWDRKQEIATRKALQYEHINIKTISLEKFRNPFGIGQYVNHPPPGGQPNLMSYSYDIPNEFPLNLRPFIPNDYFQPPRGLSKRPGTIMHCVILVATRKIEEKEELLLNYRFNPSNPYPDWYSQPDLEEAKRRWGHVKVL